MQFKHQAADYNEAESDHDCENADKEVVIVPLILQLVHLAIEVYFLIAGETSPHFPCDIVHVLTFEHYRQDGKNYENHAIDYRENAITLDARGHPIGNNLIEAPKEQNIEDGKREEGD